MENSSKKQLLFSFICTFLWGMAAHASIFMQNSFSHDSLGEFNGGNLWKMQLGRVFVPAYRAIMRTSLTIPWIIGILSLIWIGIAVFLTVKIFSVQSKVIIALIAGIFSVNLTVTATAATYIHDLDCDMFALLLSVLAVFLWKKYKKGFIGGMFCVGISLGFYQSYFSVTITLVLIDLIMELLDGTDFQKIIKKGLCALAMFLGGGILYWVALKIIPVITGVSLISGNYNSVDKALSLSWKGIIYNSIAAWKVSVKRILTAVSGYPQSFVRAIHLVMIGVFGMLIFCMIFLSKNHQKEKMFSLVLIAILPLSMNVAHVLTGGMSHDLMFYAVWLVYLLVILTAGKAYVFAKENKCNIYKKGSVVLLFLVAVILWGNVQTANAVYLEKEMEQRANASFFTRVLYEMEHTAGYTGGETPVVFVGKPDSVLTRMEGFEKYYSITGNEYYYVIGALGRGRYKNYFEYNLGNPLVIANNDVWQEMQENEEVKKLPSYPAEGSLKMIDGTLIVKLGD